MKRRCMFQLLWVRGEAGYQRAPQTTEDGWVWVGLRLDSMFLKRSYNLPLCHKELPGSLM